MSDVCFFSRVFDSKGVSVLTKEKENPNFEISIQKGLELLFQEKFSFLKKSPEIGETVVIIFLKKLKNVQKGDVLKFKFQGENTFPLSSPNFLVLTENKQNLEDVYLTTKTRFEYAKKVKDSLVDISKLPVGKQCVKDFYGLTEKLGAGCYANVYSSNSKLNYAVKISKLKPVCFKNLLNPNFSCWHEYFLLSLFSDAVKKKFTPNLPVIYDFFVCESCELMLEKQKMKLPCSSTVIELASGTLKSYLQEERTLEELHSCLFQIMSGLYVIQSKFQVMNFDIKKENILFYKVKPGGFWLYKIKGKKYFVPNFGALFVLNDFGISRSMSPKYIMYKKPEDAVFRLGSRFAVVKDGAFLPISHTGMTLVKSRNKKIKKRVELGQNKKSKGGEFYLDRETNKILENKISMSIEAKKYLKKAGIKIDSLDFFLHPEVIPPFEFYNDTQDAIRMFTGGKRTTQSGDHKKMNLNKEFLEQLTRYVGEGSTLASRKFSSPTHVLASCFIEDFFSKFSDYTKREENIESIIEIFEA